MSWSRWASFWLSAALGSVACSAPPSIELFGDSTRPAEGRRIARASSLFDGKTLHLRGARGETLGLNLRTFDGRTQRVRLGLPRGVAQVSAFAVRALEVKQPSTDMYGPSLGRGRYPDALLPSPGGVNIDKQAYFDVEIGQATSAGRYLGQLVIGARTIPIELLVSSARIDLR